MKIKIWLFLALVFGWNILSSVAKPSYAVNSGGLGVYPDQSEWNPKNEATKSWFVYTLNPGEIKNAKVDVKNDSDQPVTLKIYPVDAVTTKDGSFAPQSEDSTRKEVGAWINMPTTEVSLNPKEIKKIDFTITVPSSVEVGDHMGAIIIQNKKGAEVKAGTTVQIVNRLGARIYITIPGKKISKLEIDSFDNTMEDDKIVFQLSLINKGNTRIAPKGEIEIKNESGELVDKIDLTQREIFPKNTIVLPIKWEKTVKGNFTVVATVTYDNQKLTKELKINNKETEKKVLGVSNVRKKINKLSIVGMGLIVVTILILTTILRFL